MPQVGAFVIYAVMVANLTLRPHGLFGVRRRDKRRAAFVNQPSGVGV